MGGVEATQQARKCGYHMPIYMVTGNTGLEYVKMCEEAGATGHLSKPIDKQALMKVLTSIAPSEPSYNGDLS